MCTSAVPRCREAAAAHRANPGIYRMSSAIVQHFQPLLDGWSSFGMGPRRRSTRTENPHTAQQPPHTTPHTYLAEAKQMGLPIPRHTHSQTPPAEVQGTLREFLSGDSVCVCVFIVHACVHSHFGSPVFFAISVLACGCTFMWHLLHDGRPQKSRSHHAEGWYQRRRNASRRWYQRRRSLGNVILLRFTPLHASPALDSRCVYE